MGKHSDDTAGRDTGAVYVFRLEADADTVASFHRISDGEGGVGAGALPDNGFFGSQVAVADFEGDGSVELVVASRSNDDSGSNFGALYVLWLDDDMLVTRMVTFTSGVSGMSPAFFSPGSELGWGAAVSPDVSGAPGFPMILAGTTRSNRGMIMLSLSNQTAFEHPRIATRVVPCASLLAAAPPSGFDPRDLPLRVRPDEVLSLPRDGASGADDSCIAVLLPPSAGPARDAGTAATVRIGAVECSSTSWGPAWRWRGLPWVACEGPPGGKPGAVHDIVVSVPAVPASGAAASTHTVPSAASFGFLVEAARIEPMSVVPASLAGLAALPAGSATFATAVSRVGDVDGNGLLDEIVVGAAASVADDTSAVYVIWLDSAGGERAHTAWDAESNTMVKRSRARAGSRLGAALCDMGDVDGDTRAAEIAVGAPLHRRKSSEPAVGAVFVTWLSEAGEPARMVEVSRDTEGFSSLATVPDGSLFGSAVAFLGRDGRDTVLAVGAPGDGPGAAFLVVLSPLASLVSVQKLANQEGGLPASMLGPGEAFGSGLGLVLDPAPDGSRLLAVGSPGANGGKGRVLLLTLGSERTVTDVDVVVPGTGAMQASTLGEAGAFGSSVTACGDPDGAGFPALLVGAPTPAGASGEPGRAVLLRFHGARPDPGASWLRHAAAMTPGPSAGATDWLTNTSGFGSALECTSELDGRLTVAVGLPGLPDPQVRLLRTGAGATFAGSPRVRVSAQTASSAVMDAATTGPPTPLAPERQGYDFVRPQADPLGTMESAECLWARVIMSRPSLTLASAKVRISGRACDATRWAPWAAVTGKVASHTVDVVCCGMGKLPAGSLADLQVTVAVSPSTPGGAIVAEVMEAPGAVQFGSPEAMSHVSAGHSISRGLGGLPGTFDFESNLRFGSSVAWIGDVPGVAGGHLVVVGTLRKGLYVLQLGEDGIVTRTQGPLVRDDGMPAGLLPHGTHLGESVAWAGESEDGAERKVLAGNWSDGPDEQGAFYVLRWGLDAQAFTSGVRIAPGEGGLAEGIVSSDARLGTSLAWLGDLDGDGRPWEVAVGAPSDDIVLGNTGTVLLVWLTSGDAVRKAELLAPGVNGFPLELLRTNDRMGAALAWTGVKQGSGTGLAIGNEFKNARRGAVFLLQLDAQGSATSVITLAAGESGLPANMLRSNDRFGSAVAWMGNSATGLTQLAIGARRDADAGGNAGAVYIVHVGEAVVDHVLKLLPGIAGMDDTLVSTSSLLGSALAWVGDRQGSIGLLVGAPQGSSGNRGVLLSLRIGRPGLVATDIGAGTGNTTLVTSAVPAAEHPMDGGSRVSLRGRRLSLLNSMLRLAWPTSVTIGGRPCADVRGNAAGTVLNCTMPPGFGASAGVSVKVGSAPWANGTVWVGYAPPRVMAARPPTGLPQAGGGILVVDGTGLVPVRHFPEPPPGAPDVNISLLIGPFPCLHIRRVQDGTQLRCESTPPGAGRNHPITVRLPGDQVSVGTALVAFEPGRVDAIAPSWVLPRASGNMSFQVNGTGFGVSGSDVTRAEVGGNPCGSVRWVSPTSLWCDDVRAGAFTTRTAVVHVDGVPSDGGLGVLDYPPPPTVVGANRTDVPAAGGAAVTLFGSNLGSSAAQISAVLVGETPCLSWGLLSQNTIECVTPPGVGAALTVSVITAGGIRGRSAIPFLGYSPPTVASLDPSYAFSDETVTYDIVVKGRNFGTRPGDVSAASVGGVPCGSIVHRNDTVLECRGLHAPWADRTVRVVSGGQAVVRDGLFDFLPPPSIDGVTPDVGPTVGGTNITIFGAGFGVSQADLDAVTVGGRPCASFALVSQTEVRCTVPPGDGAGRAVRVRTVANGANGPSDDALFSYDPPRVSSVAAEASVGGAAFAGLPLDALRLSVTDAGANASRLEGLTVSLAGWTTSCGAPLAAVGRGSSGQITQVRCPNMSFAGAPTSGGTGTVVLRVAGQASVSAAGLAIIGRPSVGLVNPSSSPSTGRGNATDPAVVVVGERFGASRDDVLSVSVGGVPCPAVRWDSPTSLLVSVPPGAGLGRRVVVTTRAGLASRDQVVVSYLAPAVASVSPTYAFAGAAAQPIVVRGSNLGSRLGDVDYVRVGGRPCGSVEWVSPSELRCDADMAAFAASGQPSFDPAVTVSVGGQSQAVAGTLSVVARPAVNVLNPDTVPTLGGTVTVLGTGFGRVPSDVLGVAFGGTSSAAVRWVSPTELEVDVPPGAGAGHVTSVTTRGGLSSTVSTRALDYRKAEVSRLEPTYAMTGDLTADFVIHGSDFGNSLEEVTGVLVGGNPCAETEFVSHSRLVCRGVNGSRWLDNSATVTVGEQEGLRNSYFQHFGAPNITDIAPRFAAELEPVFILGTGFGFKARDVRSVTVDGTPCNSVVHRGPTTLSCYMPRQSAALKARAAIDRRALGGLPLVVTTSGGLSSAPALVSYEGAGASIREPPRHLLAFRNVGVWQTVLVRFSFPEHDPTSDVVRVNAFELQLTTQVATAAGGSTNTTELRVVDAEDADATTPTRDQVVVYLLELRVATQAPVAIRVRALNPAGTGPWSPYTAPVPSACRENEFLTSHLDVARWACEPCPANAFCGGAPSDNVTALAGTWRVPWSESLLGFAPCPVPEACLGYEDAWGQGVVGGEQGTGNSTGGTNTSTPAPDGDANQTEVDGSGGGSIVDGQDPLLGLVGGGSTTQLAALAAVLDSTQAPTARPRYEWGSSAGQEGCASGYRGTLCSSCEPGFTRWGIYECRECADALTVTSLSVVVVLVVFAGVCVLVLNALRANSKGVKVEVAAMKIVFSHLQTVAIAAAFDLRWPEIAMTLFSTMSSATSVSSDMLSIDCILEITAAAAGRQGASAPVPVPRDSSFLARSVVMLAVPIVLLLLAGVFWGCLLPACECCCSGVERTSSAARTAASTAATRVRRASMAVRTSSRQLSGGKRPGVRGSVLVPTAGGNAILATPPGASARALLTPPPSSSVSDDGGPDAKAAVAVHVGGSQPAGAAAGMAGWKGGAGAVRRRGRGKQSGAQAAAIPIAGAGLSPGRGANSADPGMRDSSADTRETRRGVEAKIKADAEAKPKDGNGAKPKADAAAGAQGGSATTAKGGSVGAAGSTNVPAATKASAKNTPERSLADTKAGAASRRHRSGRPAEPEILNRPNLKRGTLLPGDLQANPMIQRGGRTTGKGSAAAPKRPDGSALTIRAPPLQRAVSSPSSRSPLRRGAAGKLLLSNPPPGTPPALHLPPIANGVSMRGDTMRANPLHPAAGHIGGEITKARFRPTSPQSSRREWCQCLSISEKAIGVRLSLLDKVFVSFVITLFVVHMSVTKSSLQLLTCTTVARDVEPGAAGGGPVPSSLGLGATGLPPGCPADAPALRVAGDLELCCSDPSVQTFTLLFGVPGVVVYAVGIPICAAWLLTLYRNRLTEPRVRATLGFLFAGYRREAYYWEAVVMLRKVLVSAIAVFLAPQGVAVQTYAVIVLIFLLSLAQAMKRPFASRTLNRLELGALATAFFTFVAGLFQLTSSSEGVKVSATLFMVGLNILFLSASALVVLAACRRRRKSRKPMAGPALLVLKDKPKVKSLSARSASSGSLRRSARRVDKGQAPSRVRKRL